ncbi:4Fe-4S binding protein [Candidatus Methanocrinis natronophilus]|uniref:4Fe-4S binding protein n=1 Tax=Candidatus Methanocrinis natronophilus TaxID=3033396 RepID=A0ABT5X7M3_9EURY|nr:4Fe-4S binding protein [Candidatus Methanocrinis natronophilus]MDF0590577.1 4Fe-4S binding protein [Candidatus Methanocrinis natronophilus]
MELCETIWGSRRSGEAEDGKGRDMKDLRGGGDAKVAVSDERKKRRLKVAHPERCIGCLSCMFACSRINTRRASLDRSAIRVKTQGGLEGDFAVVICRACKDPPCVRACPRGALEKRENGRVIFKRELCDGCGACAEACLIRAISIDSEGKAIKCKHCGACVAFCPHGVLEMEEVEE